VREIAVGVTRPGRCSATRLPSGPLPSARLRGAGRSPQRAASAEQDSQIITRPEVGGPATEPPKGFAGELVHEAA